MKESLILMFLLFFLMPISLACEEPPLEQYVSDVELIDRTKNIVLATVHQADLLENGFDVEYSFEVVRSIKGELKKNFSIQGSPLFEGWEMNFNHHNESKFWDEGWGRSHSSTDCLIHPGFTVGGTYLIFYNAPYHKKSFERVIRTEGESGVKDKWLEFVENYVLSNK